MAALSSRPRSGTRAPPVPGRCMAERGPGFLKHPTVRSGPLFEMTPGSCFAQSSTLSCSPFQVITSQWRRHHYGAARVTTADFRAHEFELCRSLNMWIFSPLIHVVLQLHVFVLMTFLITFSLL